MELAAKDTAEFMGKTPSLEPAINRVEGVAVLETHPRRVQVGNTAIDAAVSRMLSPAGVRRPSVTGA